jgi:hypothetical protein
MKQTAESESKMDFLDENRIDAWIRIFQEAKQFGFSFPSSPIEPLLEVMVDLSLQLSNLLQEGMRTWEHRSNKTLKFSETQVDALANPKVITSEKRRNLAWDPLIAHFFKELSQTLVRLKQSHQLPKDLYSYGSRCAESNRQKHSAKLKPSVYHFYRRTRGRKKQ